MSIEDAFTREVIEDTDTNVGAEEEAELREVIHQIYASNQFDVPNKPEEDIAVLCFVAGRAYQALTKPTGVQITMSEPMLEGYLEFLVQRGER